MNNPTNFLAPVNPLAPRRIVPETRGSCRWVMLHPVEQRQQNGIGVLRVETAAGAVTFYYVDELYCPESGEPTGTIRLTKPTNPVGANVYYVDTVTGACTCPDYVHRRGGANAGRCKHYNFTRSALAYLKVRDEAAGV
jgi:hypothetical protein